MNVPLDQSRCSHLFFGCFEDVGVERGCVAAPAAAAGFFRGVSCFRGRFCFGESVLTGVDADRFAGLPVLSCRCGEGWGFACAAFINTCPTEKQKDKSISG